MLGCALLTQPAKRAAWAGQRCPRRLYSAEASDTAIYHSASTNPWFNLAFEDWIFRNTPTSRIVLYIYRNSPCVVIGRNQNPWKEVNLRKLRELDVPFVRRRSGGGTVYHDLGNSNYCVFMPRTQFERKTNALLVSDALNNLDINTYVNDRNDICMDGYKMSSAFKLVNARAYHHGTMLIDAKLQDLKGVLSNEKAANMVSKGVESVPSPVRNLRHWSPELDHQSFFDAVATQFAHVYETSLKVTTVDEKQLQRNDYLRKSYEELQTWDWQWGQTPEFTVKIAGAICGNSATIHITAHHGLITNFHIESPDAPLSEERDCFEKASQALQGQKYENLLALEKLAVDASRPSERQVYSDLLNCLRECM